MEIAHYIVILKILLINLIIKDSLFLIKMESIRSYLTDEDKEILKNKYIPKGEEKQFYDYIDRLIADIPVKSNKNIRRSI